MDVDDEGNLIWNNAVIDSESISRFATEAVGCYEPLDIPEALTRFVLQEERDIHPRHRTKLEFSLERRLGLA